MQNVKLLVIRPFVCVHMDLLVIHSLGAFKQHYNQSPLRLHVHHHHVVQMLYAEKETMRDHAVVLMDILEIHTKVVDQNALSTLTVHQTELVLIINVPIHVRAAAAVMLNVK